ncbi:PfkB family carbohydrate kinase [Enemella dayhoffiae]|nr:PfkB family carbohydrate kinase [Enemella dayhoffiae]
MWWTGLALLTDMPVSSLTEIEAAARKLLSRGVREVLVTLGERAECCVARTTAATTCPGAPVVAVDSTGAGDAFSGAFAHRYATDGDVASAIANRYAADSVTRHGTQSSFAAAAEFVG